MTARTADPAAVLADAGHELLVALADLVKQHADLRAEPGEVGELLDQLTAALRRARGRVRRAPKPAGERPAAGLHRVPARPVLLEVIRRRPPAVTGTVAEAPQRVAPTPVAAILPPTVTPNRGATMTQPTPPPPPPEQRWWQQPPAPTRPPAQLLPPRAITSRAPDVVTWIAAGLTVLALVVASTARVMDYQTVIVFGTVALLTSIAGAVVDVRHRRRGLLVVVIVAAVLAVLVLVTGFDAMGQYQDIVHDLGR